MQLTAKDYFIQSALITDKRSPLLRLAEDPLTPASAPAFHNRESFLIQIWVSWEAETVIFFHFSDKSSYWKRVYCSWEASPVLFEGQR